MEVKTYTIPPKERKEWEALVKAKTDHKFQNFVLQMKTAEYSRKIHAGEITLEQAVNEMYELSKKYSLAVQNDFKQIFKEW